MLTPFMSIRVVFLEAKPYVNNMLYYVCVYPMKACFNVFCINLHVCACVIFSLIYVRVKLHQSTCVCMCYFFLDTCTCKIAYM